MYDLIIIGAGPAGISASLYAKRANLDVLVIYKGISNVEKAVKIDNYYGFPNGITGEELYENGINQAKNLEVDFVNDEVVAINNLTGEYEIKTPTESYKSKSVIISTGNNKINPDIKGIKEFEGKGISYCAICDAFFYRNKRVAIIGNGEFAFSEAKILKNVTNKISILTDNLNIKSDNKEFEIINKKVKELKGTSKVELVVFEDDTELEVDGIFVVLGEAGAIDFAKTLGILIDENNIKVNEKMETNIPGIYACGNVTGGLLQVNKAVYEGAIAGLNAVKYIKGGN